MARIETLNPIYFYITGKTSAQLTQAHIQSRLSKEASSCSVILNKTGHANIPSVMQMLLGVMFLRQHSLKFCSILLNLSWKLFYLKDKRTTAGLTGILFFFFFHTGFIIFVNVKKFPLSNSRRTTRDVRLSDSM